jgi:hypothetical protein
MKRRVLVITNPGKKDATNYCEGVYRDKENYFNYFNAPYGGYWSSSELRHLDKPSKSKVQAELKSLSDDQIEFSIIIFCGHGWYSSIDKTTVIELNDTDQMNALDLRINANKRIIILDNCRKVYPTAINASLEKTFNARMLLEKAGTKINPELCKIYYNDAIDKCPKQINISYGYNLTEVAGDDPRFGGYYSTSLIGASKDWAENNLQSIGLSKRKAVAVFPECHNLSLVNVRLLSGGTQNPQIESPRVSSNNDYLPFAIVA